MNPADVACTVTTWPMAFEHVGFAIAGAFAIWGAMWGLSRC